MRFSELGSALLNDVSEERRIEFPGADNPKLQSLGLLRIIKVNKVTGLINMEQ
jgi:hypothetical protein